MLGLKKTMLRWKEKVILRWLGIMKGNEQITDPEKWREDR